MKNIQYLRKELENHNFFLYLKETFPGDRILIGNNIFIHIPKNKNKPITKYFLSKSIYMKEHNAYTLLKGKILMPSLFKEGKKCINLVDIYYISLENVRGDNSCISSYKNLDLVSVGNIVSILHSIINNEGNYFLHGNLNVTNFFKNKDCQIGLFDFSSVEYGLREQDLANLYFNMDFNQKMFKMFMQEYKYSSLINQKKVLFYLILKIKDELQNNIYINKFDRSVYKVKINYFIAKYKLQDG